MVNLSSTPLLHPCTPPAAHAAALQPHRARIPLRPVARGQGATLGAALQRVLLTALPGCAATEVFCTAVPAAMAGGDGLSDAALHLLLQLRGVVFRLQDPALHSATVLLQVDGAAEVCAGDILAPAGVRVLNPAHPLTRLAAGERLALQIRVARGRGHQPGLPQRGAGTPLAVGACLPLDAAFSPVRQVRSSVEPARGQPGTVLDRLVLDIETDGSRTPHQALTDAAGLLAGQLGGAHADAPPATGDQRAIGQPPIDRGNLARLWQSNPGLFLPIDRLGLSVRSHNALRGEGIARVGDLVQRTDTDLLRTPNLGRKSLQEIHHALAQRGWTLGMQLPGWPPAPGQHPH